MVRVAIRPVLGGIVPLFQACPGKIIKCPVFSLSHAAQLDLRYGKVSRDKLGHVGSEPYLNDGSGRKAQQTGSEIGGDLFFLEIRPTVGATTVLSVPILI